MFCFILEKQKWGGFCGWCFKSRDSPLVFVANIAKHSAVFWESVTFSIEQESPAAGLSHPGVRNMMNGEGSSPAARPSSQRCNGLEKV